MGTILSSQSVGEPLLARGTTNPSPDYTFRQLRQLTQAFSEGVLSQAAFKVTQRGAGANLSVDVADGGAWVQGDTDTTFDGQQKYGIPGVSATVNLGSITAPVGATRRDMVVLQVYDEGETVVGGGKPDTDSQLQYIKNAAETTTAETTPVNALLLAYVDVTVGAGSITNAMITDMRPVAAGTAGQRSYLPIATAETTASTTFVKLTTPDQIIVEIKNAGDLLRLRYKAHWKISVASGTQTVAFFLKNMASGVETQLKTPPASGTGGVPVVAETGVSIATVYSHLATDPIVSGGFRSAAGGGSDVSDVTTGQILAGSTASSGTGSALDVYNLAAGLYTVSVQFKTSANTLSVQNRKLWAEVIPFVS